MITTKITYTCACCNKKQVLDLKGVQDPLKTNFPSDWDWVSQRDHDLCKVLYFCSRECACSFRPEAFRQTYSASNDYYGLRASNVRKCDHCTKVASYEIIPETVGGLNNAFANWYHVQREKFRFMVSPPKEDKGAEVDICSPKCLQESTEGILKPYRP